MNYKNINKHELEQAKSNFRYWYDWRHSHKDGSSWVTVKMSIISSLDKLKELKRGVSNRIYYESIEDALRALIEDKILYCDITHNKIEIGYDTLNLNYNNSVKLDEVFSLKEK